MELPSSGFTFRRGVNYNDQADTCTLAQQVSRSATYPSPHHHFSLAPALRLENSRRDRARVAGMEEVRERSLMERLLFFARRALWRALLFRVGRVSRLGGRGQIEAGLERARI
jgi:hypothetical protein